MASKQSGPSLNIGLATQNRNALEKVPCNLCGSSAHKIIYESRYDQEKDKDLAKKFRSSGDELLIDQLVQCPKCRLKFINPRLKQNLIIEGYTEGEDPLFISQADARERTFFKALRKIEKYAPKKGKILDVGTAGGSFLAAAKKRGWTVSGCEPNKWLVDWGNKKYNIKIDQGTIFEQKYPSNSFDVITLWDVIEHTPDPMKVLEECNRLLKENGILVVNYPDIGSWLARLLGRKWLFLTSVHLYYFTPRTIRHILSKTGFKIELIKPYFQSLELGYIMFRAGTYSSLFSTVGKKMVELAGLAHREVPYWLGQTFVLARKRSK